LNLRPINLLVPALLAGQLLAGPIEAQPKVDGPQNWVADPAKSTLAFTATQEGAEFSGRFNEFSAGILLQPSGAEFTIMDIGATIRLASVDTLNSERDDYLKQEDWFDIRKWPEAAFRSDTVQQLGNGRFKATGELLLRGVSRPVQLELVMTIDDNAETGRLQGKAAINRLDFGVGQGEWASTEWIGATVNIEFDLYILRAFE